MSRSYLALLPLASLLAVGLGLSACATGAPGSSAPPVSGPDEDRAAPPPAGDSLRPAGESPARSPSLRQAASESGPIWNLASPYPDRIILTWAGDPATTQSVTWRTDTTVGKASAQVALAGPAPDLEDSAVTVEAATRLLDARHVAGAEVQVHYHSVTFTELLPDTLYAYRVGSEQGWSEWFHFRTAALESEPFAFLYFGDAQNGILSLWSRTLRESYAKAPDARFMIHAGDLVNRAHSDLEWGEWFRSGGHIHSMVPSLPATGNHEYRGYETLEGERPEEPLSVFWGPQFTLPENGPAGVTPETCFYLDFQGVRVVVLNSSEDHEAQALWMDEVLANNPMPWTVITHHHPIFSSAGSRDNDELRSLWKPIYDRHGVDLVLQGHDHTYARGRTLPPSEDLPIGEPLPAGQVRASGLNRQDGETGTVYLVSVGGRKMYDFKPTNWESYQAELDRKAEDTQLFQVIRVEGDTMKVQAFTATGQLFDAFDLIKQEGRPNRLVDRTPG